MAHNHDEIIEHYNRFHAAVYGPEGALDRKTRHLICLWAALGADCEFCTKYALGVLKELQASDAEIDEAISVAMTVGASNPRLLAKKVRAENPSETGSTESSTKSSDDRSAGCGCCA